MSSEKITDNSARIDGLVTCATDRGEEIRGTVKRLTRHGVCFEVYNPVAALQTSEVLGNLQIVIGERICYAGRAVITGLVHTGLLVVCEARLEGSAINSLETFENGVKLGAAYEEFFRHWQRSCHISPEFKTLVMDVEAFLVAVEQWLQGLELGHAGPNGALTSERECELFGTVVPRIISAFNGQHERFEELAYAVPLELRGFHHQFVGRYWQRLFLCSPFGRRTFGKPLGYAGDYEMMNMIHRNQPEGSTLYAKLIHLLLVSQWPAQSVRNRIAHLKQTIVEETLRVASAGRRCRVLNIGCGPAREIQDLLQETPVSDKADFTLLDFNEETLLYTNRTLGQVRQQFHRRSQFETRRLSVHQLLRRRGRQNEAALQGEFDLIYCAGLFDYLCDEMCRSLVDLFYQSLRPGGLVLVANMTDEKPFRNFIEAVLDWHLIYRGAASMKRLAPARAPEGASVVQEDTSVNLFLQVRRPP